MEAWIRSMWERLSVGEIAVEAEVRLFYDAFKVGLPSAREKTVRSAIESLTHCHLKGFNFLHF
jgi:hypothetical protein